MSTREQILRLIACVCLAAILLAVAAPVSGGLFFAVLGPVVAVVAAPAARRCRTEADPQPPLSGFLFVFLSRAPPEV